MENNFADIISFLNEKPDLQGKLIAGILAGETGTSSAGYPFISDESFNLFRDCVPHLFSDGQHLLSLFDQVETKLGNKPSVIWGSWKTAIRVLRNIIYTAGVTAPPDLWILRQVWESHRETGITTHTVSGAFFDPEKLSVELQLNPDQLQADLHFLYARGYLEKKDSLYKGNKWIKELQDLPPLSEKYKIDITSAVTDWFINPDNDLPKDFFKFQKEHENTGSWIASASEIETGYRLLPLVLALRTTKKTIGTAVKGQALDCELTTDMQDLLHSAGVLQENIVTELGARILSRGPGPYGIIGAYQPYLVRAADLLKKGRNKVWVQRGANVTASQLANSKSFAQANNQLDRYSRNHNWKFEVFVEHAVGQGEATRQRYERSGESRIQYFGADLEDAAIDKAIKQQSLGLLPSNMQFIRGADIGEPKMVTNYLKSLGLDGKPTVMVVGNGFHEIRNQTNEKMIEVFRGYSAAGFVLIFTEETALSDEDLRYSAWNTYHAGFRYVHEISGQGLRPAEAEKSGKRLGWRACAEQGGYTVLDDYTYRSRTIYPHPIANKANPSISVTYFCVPG